jgi:hypothetical protein
MTTQPAEPPVATEPVLAVLKRPSGFIPLLISFAAMATIVIHVSRYGTDPQPDEGAAAHIWQLLMVLNVLAIGVFAATALPRAPRAAGIVLALQITAIVAAAAPVFLLGF